jgi:2-hydroxy-3-oxopropionate reductase
MKIGFIGLGVMGVPMAGHLVGAGHSICTSLNRSGLPEELKSRDVEILDSPADVAECCDTIITMLPDSPDVESIGNINTLFSLIPPRKERY